MTIWTETVHVVGMKEMPIEEVLANPDVHWDREIPYILEEEVIEISSLSELFLLISKENTMGKRVNKEKPVKASTTKVEVTSAKVVLNDGTVYEGADVEHMSIPDLPEASSSEEEAVTLATEIINEGLVQETSAPVEEVTPEVADATEEPVDYSCSQEQWEEAVSASESMEVEAALAYCAEQYALYSDNGCPRARKPVGTIVDTFELMML